MSISVSCPPKKRMGGVGGCPKSKSRHPHFVDGGWGRPRHFAEQVGGDFLKCPGYDKKGHPLGHFLYRKGQNPKIFVRYAREDIYTWLYDHKTRVRRKMVVSGYFGILPKNLARNRKFFWVGAPPPFRQTPYETLTMEICFWRSVYKN